MVVTVGLVVMAGGAGGGDSVGDDGGLLFHWSERWQQKMLTKPLQTNKHMAFL